MESKVKDDSSFMSVEETKATIKKNKNLTEKEASKLIKQLFGKDNDKKD